MSVSYIYPDVPLPPVHETHLQHIPLRKLHLAKMNNGPDLSASSNWSILITRIKLSHLISDGKKPSAQTQDCDLF